MDHITRDELQELASQEVSPCVSIYLPLHRTYPQTREDPPLLAELLDTAEPALLAQGLDESSTKRLLKPARDLTESPEFWRSSDAEGLAVFLALQEDAAPLFRTYRLSYSVPESVDVDTRFHVTPLVRLLDWNTPFELLEIGLKKVRLYACDRQSVEPLELPAGVPNSFDEYLGGTEIGRPIQFRASAARGAGGDQVGLVHGQVSYKDDHKMRVEEFVLHIGKVFEQRLRNRPIPLVLAAVDSVHPVFREACSSEFQVAEGVSGSPDELTEHEMHQQAVQLVAASQERRWADFGGKYQTRLAHGHASHRLEVIAPAAAEGRVDDLVIATGPRVWGTYDQPAGLVSIHDERRPGDVDLLDVAVRQTLEHSGRVHAVQREFLPEHAPAAAMLRW